MVIGVVASLAGGLSASAEGEVEEEAVKQNVTIHKLKFASIPKDQDDKEITIPNTGDEMNETELATSFPESKPLAGAGFTAYDVTTAYWNAYDATKGDFEAKKEAGLAAAKDVNTDEITDEDRIFSFGLTGDGENGTTLGAATEALPITSNGKKAIYKFVETTTPTEIKTPAVPFILGLPVYSDVGELKTTVHVYPKNELKSADFGFTKYGIEIDGTKAALENAEFILKKVGGQYYSSTTGQFDATEDTATPHLSGSDGKVTIAGLYLEPGDYEFHEIDSEGVSTSGEQATTSTEIFHYRNNPVVTATVAADMTVTYTYYDQQMDEQEGDTAEAYNYKVPVPIKTVDDNDVDADQTVTFTLSQKIPDDVAQYTEYALVDNYDSRLSLLKEGMANIENFKIGTTELAPADLGATYDSGTNQFSLTFDMDLNALAEYAGQMMLFTVKMKVKPGTNLTAIKNDLTFDNNFYDKKDSTTIQTYGKRFKKIDNDTRETLEGAEFKITKGSAEAGNLEYLVLKNADGTPIPSVTGVVSDKTVDWVTSAEDATTFISPENGEFGIYGLASGTYTLEETKAPDGYVLIAPFTFTPDNTATELLVANKHKGVLPSTGGTGIVTFVLIGVVALGGAALYFTKGRRQIEG